MRRPAVDPHGAERAVTEGIMLPPDGGPRIDGGGVHAVLDVLGFEPADRSVPKNTAIHPGG